MSEAATLAASACGEEPAALPPAEAWVAAARRRDDLFAPLDPGARVGLLARSAPSRVLVWEVGAAGVQARVEPFAGYAASAADIVLAADDASLARLRAAVDGALFEALRACVRDAGVVCYMLRRRCELEERGYDELLDALGFAFMGACR